MSSSEQENRAIVRAIYESANTGDLPALLERLSPDVILHQATSLPYGGEFVGRDVVAQSIATMFTEHYELRSFEVENIAVDGDTVIGCVILCARIHKSGREIQMPLRECFTVRDGLVVEVTPFYYDTAALAAAFEA